MKKALLITGPQSSGKTIMARQLAKNAGHHFELLFMKSEHITDKLLKQAGCRQDTQAIIVDEITDHYDLSNFYYFIRNGVQLDPYITIYPAWIFCAQLPASSFSSPLFHELFDVLELSTVYQ